MLGAFITEACSCGREQAEIVNNPSIWRRVMRSLYNEWMTNRDLQRWYAVYNHRYFRNRLPDIPVIFKRGPIKYAGRTYGCMVDGKEVMAGIVIGEHLRRLDCFALLSLLHECVHVKVGRTRPVHGKSFKRERRRIILAGALDDLL